MAGTFGGGGEGGAPVDACDLNVFDGCGFESGTVEGWQARGSGVIITPTMDDAYTGDYSLAVTNRDAGWKGVQYNVLGLLTPGVTYRVSVYVRLIATPNPTRVTLTRQVNCGSGAQFPWVNNVNAVEVADGWLELTGTIVLEPSCSVVEDLLYIEAGEGSATYYVDDPMLVEE